MGYRPGFKTYNIDFTDFPGLTLTTYGASVGELMDLAAMQPKLNEPDPAKRDAIFTYFATRLVTWNMEHPDLITPTEDALCGRCGLAPGQLMPTTVASIRCLELSFFMSLVFGWMSAVAQVSGPKGLSSSNGENPLADMMMQLAQQQNPLTSPEQS